MDWFILALLAGFMDATYFMLVKRSLKTMGYSVLASGVFLFSFLISMGVSFVKGIPEIGPDFYPYLLIGTAIEVGATFIYFKALEITDLSKAVPMLAFTPVFLILTSSLILGENPTNSGIAGIILIVAGSYFLNLDNQGVLSPVAELVRNRGVRLMLLVAFLFSIESNFVKITALNSDPFFNSAAYSFLLFVAFATIALVQKADVLKTYRENLELFVLLGTVISLSGFAVNYAFTVQIVPYVISIKRLSIIFSVVYGALVFSEKNMVNRYLGALIMVVGSAVIYVL